MRNKYILIVIILAIIIGGGSLWLAAGRELPFVDFLEVEKIERAEFNKIDIDKNFASSNEKNKEVIDGLLIIRDLDKGLIRQKIEQGKEYLLRMIDEKEHGVHKYYYALNDSFENRLHTIYTSSVIYSLFKIYDFDKDEKIWQSIFDSGEFVLSMQDKDKESKSYGAFYYSFYLDSKEKEKKFVVGTASKTIFTLLELYYRTGDSKYLESTELAGQWLTTMQKSDGTMKPYLRYSGDKWVYGAKESLLYNGQVLSALSRLYKVTKEEKYYNAAEKIAKHFKERIEKEGCYLGDDYRIKNPISSSWVVLSLFDFYKISQDEDCKNIVFNCSDELLKKQINDRNDLFNYGRWQGAYSTSGNGWLSEVMVEIYKFSKEQNKEDRDKYKEAVVKATRWLIQNTYSEENSSPLKDPERALGGVFWNQGNKYVRTDSVCHGLNAYVGIIDDLEEGILLSIPEGPPESSK